MIEEYNEGPKRGERPGGGRPLSGMGDEGAEIRGLPGGGYPEGCPSSSEPGRWCCPESTVILPVGAAVTDRRLGSFCLVPTYRPSRRDPFTFVETRSSGQVTYQGNGFATPVEP
jgi:hypothetical protein